VIRLDRLDRIVEFDAANLCVTAEAGLKLAALQTARPEAGGSPPGSARRQQGDRGRPGRGQSERAVPAALRDGAGLGARDAGRPARRRACSLRRQGHQERVRLRHEQAVHREPGHAGDHHEVTVKLLPLPATRAAVVGLFPDLAQATEVVQRTLESVLLPEAMDLLDADAMTLVAPRLGLEAPAGACGSGRRSGGQPGDGRATGAGLLGILPRCGRPRDAYSGRTVRAGPGTRFATSWDCCRLLPAGRVLCKIAVPIGRTGELFASAGALGRRHGLLPR